MARIVGRRVQHQPLAIDPWSVWLRPELWRDFNARRAVREAVLTWAEAAENKIWPRLASLLLSGDPHAGRFLARIVDRAGEARVAPTLLWLAYAEVHLSVEPGQSAFAGKGKAGTAALLELTAYASSRLSVEAKRVDDVWCTTGINEADRKARDIAMRGPRLTQARVVMHMLNHIAYQIDADAWQDVFDNLIRLSEASQQATGALKKEVVAPPVEGVSSGVSEAATSIKAGAALINDRLQRSKADREHEHNRNLGIDQPETPGEPQPPPSVPHHIVGAGVADAIDRLGSNDRARMSGFRKLAKPLPLAKLPAAEVVARAIETLDREAPNFSAATARVRAELAFLRAAGSASIRLRPLLLVGAPGSGKTRWARRLAELLAMPFASLDLAATDVGYVQGSSKTWSSSHPSWLLDMLARLGHAGPVILWDEVDKAMSSSAGRSNDPLLQYLEPSTACRATDPQLDGPLDLSRVSHILAANDLRKVPAPLLSRCRVVNVEPLPVDRQTFEIVMANVRSDLAAEYGVPDARLLPELTEAESQWLLERWQGSGSARHLRKLTERLLAASAERGPGAMH
ncbi:AAA family ATPase [Falsiroseomonas oryzae]|uniref:AAA family ATPase n=1 Tax=Falsiroseomonas oryzae TaxID=2766473 RepID=UPI0022EA5ABF|nr:AAA family ATPase [Roseomonas sp. MO-31]